LQIERRILRNTAVLGTGEAIGQIAGFAFVIICGRIYGAAGLGWYSLAMAIGAVAAVFVSLGTHGLLLRELAQRPEDSARRVGGTLAYEAGLAIAVWLVVAALAFALVEDAVGRWVIAAVSAYHLALLLTALRLIPSRARQIMWPNAAVSATTRPLILLIIVPLALLGLPADSAFLAFPAVALTVLGVVIILAKRLPGGRIIWRPNRPSEQWTLYCAGLPFFSVAIVNVLYARIGVFMIAALAGEESVGIYAAADRIPVVLGVLQLLFVSAAFPAVAQLAATDRARGREVASRCMRLLLVLSITAAGLLAIFHREIIQAMFGPAFRDSTVVLLLLAPAFVVKGVNALWGSQATAIGLQSTVARLRMFALATLVLFGLQALPWQGRPASRRPCCSPSSAML
jgi:O-antigen/teichoic acid export membrane protein